MIAAPVSIALDISGVLSPGVTGVRKSPDVGQRIQDWELLDGKLSRSTVNKPRLQADNPDGSDLLWEPPIRPHCLGRWVMGACGDDLGGLLIGDSGESARQLDAKRGGFELVATRNENDYSQAIKVWRNQCLVG